MEYASHFGVCQSRSSDATLRRLVRQAIDEVLDFIHNYLWTTQTPSFEQREWIRRAIEDAELILHDRMSADDLDMSGPPADEDDIIGWYARARRRVERRIRDRRERQRRDKRPWTADPEALESEVSDAEIMMDERW